MFIFALAALLALAIGALFWLKALKARQSPILAAIPVVASGALLAITVVKQKALFQSAAEAWQQKLLPVTVFVWVLGAVLLLHAALLVGSLALLWPLLRRRLLGWRRQAIARHRRVRMTARMAEAARSALQVREDSEAAMRERLRRLTQPDGDNTTLPPTD